MTNMGLCIGMIDARKEESIAHRLKKRWATAEKTLPMIFQNHGQRFLK